MTTRYYHHDACLDHLTPPGHPERPDRLRAIAAVLGEPEFDRLARQEAPIADVTTFASVHPQQHVDAIAALIPETGMVRIDADTCASANSWQAVLRATGAANAAVDDVFEKRADNAFAAMRPPGHHAERDTAMGFCLVNTIAIAARHAQQAHGAERVAIVDWDVHHGNGTQDIFYDDPSVLYASTHQMPLYPGTGAISETGVGNIFNAPLSAGDGSDAFRAAFSDKLLPAIDRHQPDLILISAGFDAHFRDPLAEIELEEVDFDWATGKLMDVAERHCDGRIVSVLEGGYDLAALSASVAAHVARLMGSDNR